jgi:tripartite-type tricarboxylate transporter receptor subunit TctC
MRADSPNKNSGREAMTSSSTTIRIFGSLIAWAILLCGAASAQDYPVKPVVLVAPFAPAGPTDLVARLVAQKLGDFFGQRVVVENRPGAGGTLGAGIVARAAPDGYTLLYGSSSTHAIGPALHQNLSYDPEKSFVPVSLVAMQALVLLVNPSLPVRSIKDFIAYAKANPGKLNYGSAGIGTPSHMSALIFDKMAGFEATHVPYRSGGEVVTALVQGQIQFAFDTVFTSAAHIEAGAVRPLAVTSKERSNALPNVPTVDESGLPGYTFLLWNGLFAPAGTPKPIVDRLNAGIRDMVAAKEVRESFAKYDVTPVGGTSAEFASLIASELKKWRNAVPELGIKTD